MEAGPRQVAVLENQADRKDGIWEVLKEWHNGKGRRLFIALWARGGRRESGRSAARQHHTRMGRAKAQTMAATPDVVGQSGAKPHLAQPIPLHHDTHYSLI